MSELAASMQASVVGFAGHCRSSSCHPLHSRSHILSVFALTSSPFSLSHPLHSRSHIHPVFQALDFDKYVPPENNHTFCFELVPLLLRRPQRSVREALPKSLGTDVPQDHPTPSKQHHAPVHQSLAKGATTIATCKMAKKML